jgi:hypothetical protein
MPEMTTRRLMNLVAKYHDAHKQFKDAEAEKKVLAGKIIPELKRRGTKAMEAMGWKVTHVTQRETVYDTHVAKTVLTKRQYMRCSERIVTGQAVAQALSDGIVTPEEVAQFSERRDKASYILANPASSGDDN